MNHARIVAGFGGLLALTFAQAASADIITFGSGTSDAIGATDGNLKAVQGPLDSDFTDANFAAAMATLSGGGGVNPFVIDKHPAWVAPIAGTHYVNTRSDGVSQGATDAYMATFVLPAVTAATLSLQFSVDNLLHDIVLNSTVFDTSPGGFGGITTNGFNILGAVVEGTNRLFFRSVDVGGPAGFDFLATVEFTVAPPPPPPPPPPVTRVPEPEALSLLGLGAVLLGLMRRRREAA